MSERIGILHQYCLLFPMQKCISQEDKKRFTSSCISLRHYSSSFMLILTNDKVSFGFRQEKKVGFVIPCRLRHYLITYTGVTALSCFCVYCYLSFFICTPKTLTDFQLHCEQQWLLALSSHLQSQNQRILEGTYKDH